MSIGVTGVGGYIVAIPTILAYIDALPTPSRPTMRPIGDWTTENLSVSGWRLPTPVKRQDA